MPITNALRVTDDGQRVKPHSLPPVAHAAVVALVRALATVDPDTAKRCAVKSAIIDHVVLNSGLSAYDRSGAVIGGLLSDLAELVCPFTRSDDEAAAVLDGLPGLQGAAEAIRHRSERWDGSGPAGLAETSIPGPARILAGAELLVDEETYVAMNTWADRLAVLDREAGHVIDPHIAELFLLEVPSAPIDLLEVDVYDQLDTLSALVIGRSANPAQALDTSGVAIAAVDSIKDLLTRFAHEARSALPATIVSVASIDPSEISVTTEPVEEPEFESIRTGYHEFAHRPEFAELWQHRGVLLTDGNFFGSEAAWPLYVDGALWGALWAATSPTATRPLEPNDLAIMRAVAGCIEVAIGQARRLAEFEHLAMRDPLTGLGNRRVLEERLDQIFSRAPESRVDVALIMCDVDGLKRINDLDGHAAGDQLLIEASKALCAAAAATTSDFTVCRIGGDEFCIILDGDGVGAAHPMADLACSIFGKSGSGRSLSYGVALATPDVNDARTLLRRADEAQYEHKRFRKGLPVIELRDEDSDRRKLRRSI